MAGARRNQRYRRQAAPGRRAQATGRRAGGQGNFLSRIVNSAGAVRNPVLRTFILLGSLAIVALNIAIIVQQPSQHGLIWNVLAIVFCLFVLRAALLGRPRPEE